MSRAERFIWCGFCFALGLLFGLFVGFASPALAEGVEGAEAGGGSVNSPSLDDAVAGAEGEAADGAPDVAAGDAGGGAPADGAGATGGASPVVAYQVTWPDTVTPLVRRDAAAAFAWVPDGATDYVFSYFWGFPAGVGLGLLAWILTFCWHSIVKFMRW